MCKNINFNQMCRMVPSYSEMLLFQLSINIYRLSDNYRRKYMQQKDKLLFVYSKHVLQLTA